jgi:hypothetical protein
MDLLTEFLAGRLSAVCVESNGRLRSDGPRPHLVLPGSFNPLHEGHWELARVAGSLVGKEASFELSVLNADKPPLAAAEALRRLSAFAGRAPLWLTRAPTFAAKAELFPGALFVVGVDTAARIVDPRFYEHCTEKMTAALEHLHRCGCRFLVAGRVDAAGTFWTLADLQLPPVLSELFTEISRAAFRRDISSTQLRGAGS